jgi:sec-independent protein translocase protein TatC
VFTFIQSFAPKSITAAPDIEAYLSFVLTMFLAFGAAFEVPIVVVVLARMGIVPVEKLKDFRGYFVVLAFIIAAVITPPDVVSQLALAIPMCLLYEVGIWAAQIFIKHTQGAGRTDRRHGVLMITPRGAARRHRCGAAWPGSPSRRRICRAAAP